MGEIQGIPTHSKKDIEKILKRLRKLGWYAEVPFGHGFRVCCPHGCCKRPVFSSPRNTGDAAKKLTRQIDRCSGGKS